MKHRLLGSRVPQNWSQFLLIALGLLYMSAAQAQPKSGRLAVPIPNGPNCPTYINKTTIDGLGNNILYSVYVSGSAVYAATANGVSISTDGGQSFITTTSGLGNGSVRGICAVGSTIYAATIGGLSISTDGGTSFINKTTTSGLGHNFVRGVYATGSTIYAATTNGVSISTNGGTSFVNKTTANGLGSNIILGVYAIGSTVYAATGNGVSISTDGGQSFINKTTANGLGSDEVYSVYAIGSTIYAATTNGVSISTNGGTSFVNKTTTNGLSINNVRGVYAVGSTIYVATAGGGVSISTDGGTSFTNKTITNGLGNNTVQGVYATESTVYAATANGLSFCTPLASSNANLSSLTLSSGLISPAFAANTTTYTASVTNATVGITLTPTLADATAKVKVNGTTVVSGATSPNIPLVVGSNTLTVQVTAQDGTTTKTYSLTVTRASEVAAVSITPAYSPAICSGSGLSLTATTTGFTPTTYTWSSQPAGFSGSGVSPRLMAPNVNIDAPANYVITVVASDGTINVTAQTVVTVYAQPTLVITNDGPLSCAQPKVTLSTTTEANCGALTYAYSGPGLVDSQTSNGRAEANQSGVYSVTVTDSYGCKATDQTQVTGNTQAPTATALSQTNIACHGGANGSATVVASGGTSPYTYSWSPSGGTTAIATGLTAGQYKVRVTGANSCTATQTFTLTQPSILSGTTTLINVTTYGGSNGSATITASGGTSPYTYSWSPSGGTAATITGLTAGSYTVTVTDANGCTITRPVTITQPDLVNSPPVAAANSNQTTTVGTPFSYTVNAFTDDELVSTNGQIPVGLTYSATISPVNALTFSAATRVISGTPTMSGVSSVTITATDSGSLSASTTFTITVNPGPTSTLIATPTALSGFSSAPGIHSLSQTYTLQPANLMNPITITPPAGVEVMVTAVECYYTSSLIVPASADPVMVYVRLTGANSVVNGTITNVSGSASADIVINGTVEPPANTAPTVVNPMPAQVGTVGQLFTYTIPEGTFLDAETPNDLIVSVSGLPTGLRVVNGTISGIASGSGTSMVTVTATDPGTLSVSTQFSLTINPVTELPVPFSLLGATLINCEMVSTGQRRVTFMPQYAGAGLPGESIRFRVENEMLPTTTPGPYTLRLYSDNPMITLVATQSGSPEARFVYNWLAACSAGTSPNRPPVARSIPDQTLPQGQAFSLELADYVTDPDDQPLTFSATGLPADLTLVGSRISGVAATTSVNPITIKALDPAGLEVTTQFQLTITPLISTPAGFTIVAVTTISCQTLSTGQRQVQFLPQYGGVTGQAITFQVINELDPTQQAGPYTLNLYTDNPVISLQATQTGSNTPATYRYNWLAGCGTTTTPSPANRAPVVGSGIASQTATVGQGYTLVIPAGTFTDPDGDILSFSATGLPAGLSFTGSTLTGTPSSPGVSMVTLTAADPASLSTSLSFALTVVPATGNPPSANFAITAVGTRQCEVVSAGQRRVSFTPQYSGISSSPISFSVVNELSPTTAPGPYSLALYTDNPVITLQAQQGSSVASYRYEWLAACNARSRQGAAELSSPLQVTVLGNPVVGGQMRVEVRGAEGQALRLSLTDQQGRSLNDQTVERAASVEQQTLRLSLGSGSVLLLRVSTSTQSQTVKLINPH